MTTISTGTAPTKPEIRAYLIASLQRVADRAIDRGDTQHAIDALRLLQIQIGDAQ